MPEGILIRAHGVADLRGVGGDPGWAPLLPLLVEWASAMHGDDTLASIRARVAQLAGVAAPLSTTASPTTPAATSTTTTATATRRPRR